MDNLTNQNIPPVQPSEQPKISSNISWLKTLSIGFSLVSFCIAIGIGGYVLGMQETKPVSQNQQIISPTTKPSPTPDSTDLIGANWKTYTNIKYGFSFKYPNNFLIATEKNSAVGTYDIFFSRTETERNEVNDCLKQLECSSYPFAIKIQSLPKPSGKNLNDVILTDIHIDVSAFSPSKIDGQYALQDQLSGTTGITHHIYIDKGQTVFHIQVDTNKDLEKNVGAILSTFQFTN